MIRMINMKAAIVAVLFLSNMALTHAVLRGNRTPVDPTKELRTAMNRIRALKIGVDGDTKGTKQNKAEREPPTDNPDTPETSAPTALPTVSPTASPTHEPTGPPTGPPAEMPSMSPTTQPASDPDSFDAIIEVACKPDGDTALTFAESSSKTIICDATNPSCREAVTAVKESAELQNFFGCAGDLGEGAARKLFNKYATDAVLAEQLTMIAATNAILVTERPDAMNAACAAIAAMHSTAVADPCCQGSSGCTSAAASASSSPPFMTVAITGCTGDSACKNIGPNPLILDFSCTGESACESMNENDLNPSVVGVTFVGEASCTNPGSCEGVGHRSYGNVVVLDASCVGSDACNAAGRRSQQKTSNRFPSHISIGPNACIGIDACKDTHSTVNYGTAGKYKGSLTIGDGGCDQDRSCEKIGFNDRLGMDIIVAPGECSVAGTCRGCITAKDCDNGGAYLISNTDGACPKGDSSSGGNPTGERVEEYCIGRDSLPTETPTFFPTPLPTITRRPTNSPTVFGSAMPSTVPSEAPSNIPSENPSDVPSSLPSDNPSSLPSGAPSNQPSNVPSDQPSDLPSDQPSDQPSNIPSDEPSNVPSSLPSDNPSSLPSDTPSDQPSNGPSDQPSDLPSDQPSDTPSDQPSNVPSDQPSDVPSSLPSDSPSSLPSGAPSNQPSNGPSDQPSDLPSDQPSDTPSDQPSSAPSDQPSDLPSDQPSSMPTETPSNSPSTVPSDTPSLAPSESIAPTEVPTITMAPTRSPATIQVGCLETPGNGSSNFNPVADVVSCDGATGTCAHFIDYINALDDGKAKMIKSIFGCEPSGVAVSQEVAQKRFNSMKNDAEVTQLLLTTVATKNLLTGGGPQLTAACNGNCCTGDEACVVSPSTGVMTITESSCMVGDSNCNLVVENAIIIDSCTSNSQSTDDTCANFGTFTTAPNSAAQLGYKVIGPNACKDLEGCKAMGKDVYGNVRVAEGACSDGVFACRNLGQRKSQGNIASPIRVDISIETNACRDDIACTSMYKNTAIATGSVTVKKNACNGESVCGDLHQDGIGGNDLVIEEGACIGTVTCRDCLKGVQSCDLSSETYTISAPKVGCPGPEQSSCS